MGIVNFDYNSQTLNSTKFRDSKSLTEESRWALRTQIINELLTLKRLDDDEKITISKGGALPKTDLKSEKQAIIIIGLPASGKSTVASSIADEFGAVIIDSDYAKRKLPEFKKHLYGATIVHEESSQTTFGYKIENIDNVKSVYETCLEKNYNIVIPKIGQSPKSILKLAETLKNKNGYDVHLILIELMKRDATIRAIKRYYKTKRYVPLGLIFDGYGNDPCMCYYYLRSKYVDTFKSFGSLSTDIPFGTNPICSDFLKESPVLNPNLNYEQKKLIL